MTVDPTVLPGLLVLALELLALAGVGFMVARLVLGQADDRMALAQGLLIGPAIWGLIANFVMFVVPGLAGGIVSWALTLTLGAGLAWRAPSAPLPSLRIFAGFAAAALALYWVALASRQLLTIPDPEIHLELAAAIRAGNWPPVLPWNPWLPVYYHYGTDLMAGLLAPPFGPDLALVTELLSAYFWTGFVLVVVTALLRYGGGSALVLAPLLLTAGAWTLIGYVSAPDILQIPVPTGVPSAGLRASLADIYWPAIEPAELPWTRPVQASPPNIWKPQFVLSYALVVIVSSWAASNRERSWPAVLVIAALIGFVGLMEETVAVTTLALWVLLEAWFLLRATRGGFMHRALVLRSAAGPALAVLLLAGGGGVITGVLTGSFGGAGRLHLGWISDLDSRRPLVSLDVLPGGMGLLSIGPLFSAASAVLIARQKRIVLALVVGSTAFLLASLILQYEPSRDITRLDGHARNFALLALLMAISCRLPALRPHRRYLVNVSVVALITWPTVAAPAHGMAVGPKYGPRFDNAQLSHPFSSNLMRRYVISRPISKHVADHIRNSTAIDARILSPDPTGLSLATGRPNASGFPGHLHLHPTPGAEYVDAIRYLDPTAVRRLDFAYVHATDAWFDSLPDRARRWLTAPGFFEPLIRDETDALYRIRPAFLELKVEPDPESFEALRRAIPEFASVYLAPAVHPLDSVRAASVLTHARVFGEVHHANLYLLTNIPTEPLGSLVPDFVVVSTLLTPSALDRSARQPIWRNSELSVYAPEGGANLGNPRSAPHFSVSLFDVHETDNRSMFSVEFIDQAADQWTGQDWLLAAADTSPWAFPRDLEADGRRHAGRQWFAGQVVPGQESTVHRYEFDPRAPKLLVRGEDGALAAAQSSGQGLGPGIWTLALRLRGDWWEVALIPVMKIVISTDGEVTYEVYSGVLDSVLAP
jgi:hypothetical protein